MNVHVTEFIHEKALEALSKKATVVGWDDPGVRDFSQADGVIVRTTRITRAMLESAPRLKVVGKHGVGTDTIDLAAAAELGKTVVYTPLANVESVAELIVGLFLSVARQIPKGWDMLRAGVDKAPPRELVGMEISGKTLGLVGMGRIGQKVTVMLKTGFGMRVVGYDPYLPAAAFAALGVTQAATVGDLMAQSDCVSISVPYTPETANLLSHAEFSRCKKGAILVNASRGGIVDEDALYEALGNGTLRAAASDVFAVEPPAKDYPLFALPNFFGVPHIGASTEEGLIRMGMTVVADVLRVLEGKEPEFPRR